MRIAKSGMVSPFDELPSVLVTAGVTTGVPVAASTIVVPAAVGVAVSPWTPLYSTCRGSSVHLLVKPALLASPL